MFDTAIGSRIPNILIAKEELPRFEASVRKFGLSDTIKYQLWDLVAIDYHRGSTYLDYNGYCDRELVVLPVNLSELAAIELGDELVSYIDKIIGECWYRKWVWEDDYRKSDLWFLFISTALCLPAYRVNRKDLGWW